MQSCNLTLKYFQVGSIASIEIFFMCDRWCNMVGSVGRVPGYKSWLENYLGSSNPGNYVATFLYMTSASVSQKLHLTSFCCFVLCRVLMTCQSAWPRLICRSLTTLNWRDALKVRSIAMIKNNLLLYHQVKDRLLLDQYIYSCWFLSYVYQFCFYFL